jgi:integrase
LATGEVVTYWYAWRGGPRLRGSPGTPEFVASYNAAVAQLAAQRENPEILLSILRKYENSGEFEETLAERTKADYRSKIRIIEAEFGSMPLACLSDPRVKGEFREWRDRLAARSRRQADYAFAVLALILAWALRGGLIECNPCERSGRLYRASRADKIWTDADEEVFLAKGPAHLHLPLLLALWTGQRQGDLLRLPWSAYSGTHIRLRQSKTGIRVVIPVGGPLRAALDAAARSKVGPLILVNSEGRPWTSDGFRCSWRKACATAGIVGVTFHDLRGTAVTRLATAGCTEAEIATVTGHSLKDVRAILDSHYLHRDPALAEAAIRKLETRTKDAE